MWEMAVASLHNDVFFLIPKNVTSERAVALLPAMIRWREALRAPEVLRWHQKFRVSWNATDGRNAGAERTVWETLLEMDRFSYRAGEEHTGAISLVLEKHGACERVSFPVVWAWATHFHLSWNDSACAMRLLRTPAAPKLLHPSSLLFLLVCFLIACSDEQVEHRDEDRKSFAQLIIAEEH